LKSSDDFRDQLGYKENRSLQSLEGERVGWGGGDLTRIRRVSLEKKLIPQIVITSFGFNVSIKS